MAERTIGLTTQLNRRGDETALSRNLGTNDRMLRYRRITSCFYTDTLFVTKKAKSTRGNIFMQLFMSDKGYVKVHPMAAVADYPKALCQLAKDVVAPEILVADLYPSQKSNS